MVCDVEYEYEYRCADYEYDYEYDYRFADYDYDYEHGYEYGYGFEWNRSSVRDERSSHTDTSVELGSNLGPALQRSRSSRARASSAHGLSGDRCKNVRQWCSA